MSLDVVNVLVEPWWKVTFGVAIVLPSERDGRNSVDTQLFARESNIKQRQIKRAKQQKHRGSYVLYAYRNQLNLHTLTFIDVHGGNRQIVENVVSSVGSHHLVVNELFETFLIRAKSHTHTINRHQFTIFLSICVAHSFYF